MVVMQPTMTETSGMPEQISLRFPDGTLERAERLAKHMATLPEYQGLAVNKSRLLIQGVLRHLDNLEAEYGLTSKKARKK
jgi:hypothetical protein